MKQIEVTALTHAMFLNHIYPITGDTPRPDHIADEIARVMSTACMNVRSLHDEPDEVSWLARALKNSICYRPATAAAMRDILHTLRQREDITE